MEGTGDRRDTTNKDDAGHQSDATIVPGHVSDDPIRQARYDALFTSTDGGLIGMSGLGPAAGNAPSAKMSIEPVEGATPVGHRRVRVRSDVSLTPPVVDAFPTEG